MKEQPSTSKRGDDENKEADTPDNNSKIDNGPPYITKEFQECGNEGKT